MPSSNPARASWNAPVHTEIVTSVSGLVFLSQASDGLAERCAGTTITCGVGASSSV